MKVTQYKWAGMPITNTQILLATRTHTHTLTLIKSLSLIYLFTSAYLRPTHTSKKQALQAWSIFFLPHSQEWQ